MAYDLEEQEQLAQLKAWWNQFGNLVTWLLVAALASYAGWMFWQNRQLSYAADAARLYSEQERAAQAHDNAKVIRAAADMREKYGDTQFAAISALVAAKAAFDTSDYKVAKEQLQWVIDKAKDENLKTLARYRLATVLLDEKSYDQALKQLNGEFPAEVAAAVAELKGDILVAQNKAAEAKTAYQAALDKMSKEDSARRVLEIKLESVGGMVEPAPAA